jgi:1,4-dihydroxy-2-naphthoyl-CoA hydrolase
MAFLYRSTVHFADTDAAGVVFFANYLRICHEAYESALAASGIELKSFFSANAVLVPIAKSEASYLRPLFPGDALEVSCTPSALSENSFEIRFEIARVGPPAKVAGRVRTEHVCIGSKTRERQALPSALAHWVNAG